MNQKPNHLNSKPFQNPLRNPLIIALDVDSELEALNLSEKLAPWAGAFKLGPRLCYRYGQTLVKRVACIAPVFVDNKYFDIPSTMEAAVQASFEGGASLVTVHALAGREALVRLAGLEAKLREERPFVVLCVTILTSWNEASFSSNFHKQPVENHVKTLYQLIRESGLSGVVSSARDLENIDPQGLFVVTPGVRFEGHATHDQKRVMSPAKALAVGAQGLVVGRPIIEASNPPEMAKQFLESLGPA